MSTQEVFQLHHSVSCASSGTDTLCLNQFSYAERETPRVSSCNPVLSCFLHLTTEIVYWALRTAKTQVNTACADTDRGLKLLAADVQLSYACV